MHQLKPQWGVLLISVLDDLMWRVRECESVFGNWFGSTDFDRFGSTGSTVGGQQFKRLVLKVFRMIVVVGVV